MKRRSASVLVVLGLISVLLCGRAYSAASDDCPYKVYVILGFHANFYHSWRGDTPDEAGFGQDIRIVREIIRMLDEANDRGLDARGYWEGESLFTFEDIVPKHAPDIIDGIRRRIDDGLDEFMPAPYSNTALSATTEDELRAVIEWSITNPWGSGAKDLFGGYVPLIRPQEYMATTGQLGILKQLGIEGMVFAYSSYSFTAFSNFVDPMPAEQRYHITRMRMYDGGPEMLLFPCVSAADVVNFTSIEKWMLQLRKLQTSGKVEQDLVIHINFDADSDTWIPMLPEGLRWIPNSGGLPEYIIAVNRYRWAEFALPSEYLAEHEPVGEVTIRQDIADGGWDGNYSWAEKYPSHVIWTGLERSRLYTKRAEALIGPGRARNHARIDRLLYSGRDSSFFHRVRGLSTTHFGMSTPMVNEERQAVAERVVGDARDRAEEAERIAADQAAHGAHAHGSAHSLYSFLVKALMEGRGEAVFQMVRVPVILTDPIPQLALRDQRGKHSPMSLVNIEPLGDGTVAAELMVPIWLKPGHEIAFNLETMGRPRGGGESRRLKNLSNQSVELELGKDAGVESFSFEGGKVGGDDFLAPFITYKTGRSPKSFGAEDWEIVDLAGEQWEALSRSRISTRVPFDTPHGEVEADISVTFTLPLGAPWLIADVAVDYPYTIKDDILHTAVQKLRRYLDLRWVEVAPFQIHPRFDADRDDPIKVWKHNWLGVTSWYEMDYARINEKNAEPDSFNHQVTAGWVAVTDKRRGLLIGQSADSTTSYAFCSMRLREKNKKQQLWLNPFGSYYGKQLDYSHMGGSGLGSEIADVASAALRANGPSYNGQSESFSLLLAPYHGDRPPEKLTAEAWSFFYPAEVVYLNTPRGVRARLRQDVVRIIEEKKTRMARQSGGELAPPLAFLANPTESAVDLVWDESGDARIDGYEIEYKEADGSWDTVTIERANRRRIEPLDNGEEYSFRMRAVGMGGESDWTETLTVEVGPVKPPSIFSVAGGMGIGTIVKFIHAINVHLYTRPVDRVIVETQGGCEER